LLEMITGDSCWGCDVIAEGHGSFVDSHTVDVALASGGSRKVTAKVILVAVGGRAVKAPIDGAVPFPCSLCAPLNLFMPPSTSSCLLALVYPQWISMQSCALYAPLYPFMPPCAIYTLCGFSRPLVPLYAPLLLLLLTGLDTMHHITASICLSAS
jgi:hypothetical protein